MGCRSGIVVAGVLSVVLVGCGDSSEEYCDVVHEYGSIENLDVNDPNRTRERLQEIADVAPGDIEPLWEEFINGYSELVEDEANLEKVEDQSVELQETAQEIESDAQQRCVG